MNLAVHPVNWQFGWCLILSAFVTGSLLGLFFDQDDFLGGYAHFTLDGHCRRGRITAGFRSLAAERVPTSLLGGMSDAT